MRILIIAALFLMSCEVKVNTSDNKKTTEDTASAKTTSGSKVRNQIKLTASTVKVDQAFLLFDEGRLVPEDNKVEVGQKVLLRLIVDGWKPVNGKVKLGAAEKIETSDGQVLLDKEDLFASFEDGVDPGDARIITLTAVITRVDKLYDHFKVSFRVWDKNSNDEVAGSYLLYLK